MNADYIHTINSDGEGEKIERKVIFDVEGIHRAEAVRDLIAMANTHGDSDGYILLGVRNDGTLLGLPSSIDSAKLEQSLNTLIEPRVEFSYTEVTIQGKLIGVLTVPYSDRRFHVVLKDHIIPNNSYATLKKGETWIRHLSSKRPPTAFDYDRMKESFARIRSPRPRLIITFGNHQSECVVQPNWYAPQARDLRSFADLHREPLGEFVSELQVFNDGLCGANDISAFVGVPEGMKVSLDGSASLSKLSRTTRVSDQPKQIALHFDQLTHGLRATSYDLRFRAERPGTYSLPWSAHASNMSDAISGTLELIVETGYGAPGLLVSLS